MLWALGRWGLQWSWRAMWVGAIVIMQAFEGLYLAVIWNVGGGMLRDGWVFDAMDLTSQVASDYMFFLSIVLVRRAQPSYLPTIRLSTSTSHSSCFSSLYHPTSAVRCLTHHPAPASRHFTHHPPLTAPHRPPLNPHRRYLSLSSQG